MKHLKNAITLPFWLFTFSIILFLVISQLIQDGMFVDGLLYVSVSKNLADGLGTFWDPHVSKTFMSSFHEQPPLYFKLLAFFYTIFGDSMYVERFFCFICLSSTAFYIHKLWRKIFITDNITANNSWLPILLWISVPVCFWAYTNNVEETLMSLFVLIAVYHIYLALFLNKKVLIHYFIAGLFIFLSSLTKGIQGVFPVISVVAYYLIYKNISLRKTMYYSLILIGIPFIIYSALILINADVGNSFETYYKMRFVKTFNNVHDTTQNRFELLIRLFTELLPTIIISLFIFFSAKNNLVPKANKKLISWFLLIGLSGSLPLMVTLEQRGFYLVTTLPYFIFAITLFIAPYIQILINKIRPSSNLFKVLKTATTLLLLVAITFCILKIGKIKRDEEIITDINQFGKIIPRGEIVNIPSEMFGEYSIRYYLVRNFYISLDDISLGKRFYIIKKSIDKKFIPKGYKRYPITTKTLDLYVLDKNSL